MNDAEIARRLAAVVDGVRARGLTREVEKLQPLLPHARSPQLAGELARLLGFYWLRQGQFAKALHFSDVALAKLPGNRDAAYNGMYAAFKSGRLDEAVARGRRVIAGGREDYAFHNLLSTCLGILGHTEDARHHGTRALALKDGLTAGQPGRPLEGVPVPRFDPAQPQQQVIAFSLFGADPKYVDGALRNAAAAATVYPGWTCRFHVDASVPAAAVAALRGHGAQVLTMTEARPAARWGTFWRFFVADDPQVRRFIVRDADSLINRREAAAVREWIDSGRHFHVMRDHHDHSELVLAGMWGGVAGALPPVEAGAEAFLARNRQVQARTADQEYLREILWPTIRGSALVHDSQFGFGDVQAFPPVTLPAGCWVGGDGAMLAKALAAEGGAEASG